LCLAINKKIIMNKLFTILLGVFITFSLQAQKFGYVNSAQVLTLSPEIKAADVQLKSFQDGLIAEGESMVKKFEAKYNKYVEEANAGGLSKVAMQQKEGELAQEQQAIQQFEVEVQQKIMTKRDELYSPILDNIKQKLDMIGKENGYTMIFDSSAGGLLHAVAADDVFPLLKTKLGIQ